MRVFPCCSTGYFFKSDKLKKIMDNAQKRDEFSISILCAMLSNQLTVEAFVTQCGDNHQKQLVKKAIVYADELLKQLEK